MRHDHIDKVDCFRKVCWIFAALFLALGMYYQHLTLPAGLASLYRRTPSMSLYMFITGSILNEDVFFLPRYVLYICSGFSTAVFVLHNEFHPWLLNIRRELNHAMGLEPTESPTSSQFEYCNCNYKLLGTYHGCICVLAWFVRIWSRKEGGEGGEAAVPLKL